MLYKQEKYEQVKQFIKANKISISDCLLNTGYLKELAKEQSKKYDLISEFEAEHLLNLLAVRDDILTLMLEDEIAKIGVYYCKAKYTPLINIGGLNKYEIENGRVKLSLLTL